MSYMKVLARLVAKHDLLDIDCDDLGNINLVATDDSKLKYIYVTDDVVLPNEIEKLHKYAKIIMLGMYKDIGDTYVVKTDSIMDMDYLKIVEPVVDGVYIGQFDSGSLCVVFGNDE